MQLEVREIPRFVAFQHGEEEVKSIMLEFQVVLVTVFHRLTFISEVAISFSPYHPNTIRFSTTNTNQL